MNLFKKIIFIGAVFFTPFVYSSVQPIELGVIGQNAEVIAGAKLAVKDINSKEGVLNSPLQLNLAPNNKTLFNIAAGGNELLSRLPISSPENQKIFIMTQASLDKLPANVISLSPNDQMQGIAAAQYVSGRLYRDKAIVLYQANNASAHALANYFDGTFSSAGGAVLIDAQWMPPLSPELIQKIKQTNADIIYLAGDSESALAAITALRDANIQLPIIGNNTYSSFSSTSLISDVFFTSAGYYDRSFMEDPMINFVNAYKKEYGKPPKSIDAALGYEAVQLYAQVIQSTNTTDPDKIISALHQPKNFKLLTGDLNTVSIIKRYQNKIGVAAIIIPILKGNHE